MTTRSFLIGTTFGAACALSRIALERLFGTAPDAQVPLLVVAAAAFVLGLRALDLAPGPLRSFAKRISLRTALLALGAWVALGACVAIPAGQAVAWAGGGIGAGWLALALARALIALPLLGPPAWLFGYLVRAGLHAIPGGAVAGRAASAAMAGALAGIFSVSVAEQVPQGTQAAAALLMIALASFAIWEKRLQRFSREEVEGDEKDSEASESPRPAATFLGMTRGLFHRKPLLPACAAGMAAVICSFAAGRFFLFAEGNDLGGFPVASLVLLGGCAAGAALALLLPRAWLRERGAQIAAAALCICLVLVLWTWMRFDQLIPRFMEWTPTKIPFISLVANAGRVIAPRVAFAGLWLGFAFAALAADLPANRWRRERWLLEAGALAILGFFLALWILGQQLPHVHWEGAVLSAVLVAGLMAVLGIALAGRFHWAMGLAAAIAALLIVSSIRSAPMPLRDALLVERTLPGTPSAPSGQRNWLIFDEDDWNSSFAVLRRGHGRRLLVNGRNEVSNE
ncbi:MAG TPA: hypothetical protein VFR10_06985, partial [bacterium]|nr:hypothetical protein [bacterium]